jgi:hypothetical protein
MAPLETAVAWAAAAVIPLVVLAATIGGTYYATQYDRPELTTPPDGKPFRVMLYRQPVRSDDCGGSGWTLAHSRASSLAAASANLDLQPPDRRPAQAQPLSIDACAQHGSRHVRRERGE